MSLVVMAAALYVDELARVPQAQPVQGRDPRSGMGIGEVDFMHGFDNLNESVDVNRRRAWRMGWRPLTRQGTVDSAWVTGRARAAPLSIKSTF
jgi:hypothetical protein